MIRRAVFLDRDGVLNASITRNGTPHPPASVEDLEILPGAIDALRAFRKAGLLSIVVTNQPDVGAGRQSIDRVSVIHEELNKVLPLDGIEVCFHTDVDACDCRKPKPGMLLRAAARHGLDLSQCYLVGDRWRDIEAGQQVGCTCFFIDYNYAEKRPEPPFTQVTSLSDASRFILRKATSGFDT